MPATLSAPSGDNIALTMRAEGDASEKVRALNADLNSAAAAAEQATARSAAAAQREAAAQKEVTRELRTTTVALAQKLKTLDMTSRQSVQAFQTELAAANALAQAHRVTGMEANNLGKIEEELATQLTAAAGQAEAAAYKEARAHNATAAAIQSVGTAAQTAATKERALAQATAATVEQADKATLRQTNRARGAASAATSLAMAMSTGQGSAMGMANAAGMLATQIGAVTSNVRLMIGATGLGAALIVLTAVIGKMQEAKEKAKQMAEQRFDAQLGNLELAQQQQLLATLRDQQAAMTRQVETVGVLSLKKNTWYNYEIKTGADAVASLEAVNRQIEETTKRISETHVANVRQRKEDMLGQEYAYRNAQNALDLETQQFRLGEQHAAVIKDQLYFEHHMRLRAIDLAEQEAQRRGTHIAQTERLVVLENQRYALAKERAIREAVDRGLDRDLSTAQSGVQAKEGFGRDKTFKPEIVEQGRILEAMHQRAIAIYGEDSDQAHAAEVRKRVFMRETAKVAMQNARTITGVLMDSNSKQVKAVGHAADSMRRLIIGAQAAMAGVESAIEGGRAIAALASGDFAGAALHGAAALELAQAAALGAQESLGGGGSRGGGSGGGGTGPVFSANGSGGSGSVTLNIITQRWPNSDDMTTVRYEIDRARILNKPLDVAIPSTSGVTVRTG